MEEGVVLMKKSERQVDQLAMEVVRQKLTLQTSNRIGPVFPECRHELLRDGRKPNLHGPLGGQVGLSDLIQPGPRFDLTPIPWTRRGC